MNVVLQRIACFVIGFAFVPSLIAAPLNDDATRLSQRLQTVDTTTSTQAIAAYERLQARQAIDALVEASGKERGTLLRIAERRVEIAETAARTEAMRSEIDRLNQERADLLVEASRQEALRARREAERLRMEAQRQAEESERLRLAAEEQALARRGAELVLDDVAGAQAVKLREARKREAELARREAELMKADSTSEQP